MARKRNVWSKETPTVEGWYWIRYRNKRNRTTVCPCYVTIFNGPGLKANHVHTARNDSFMEGPNHGGWGLKYNGVPCKSIRFGPAIPEPADP